MAPRFLILKQFSPLNIRIYYDMYVCMYDNNVWCTYVPEYLNTIYTYRTYWEIFEAVKTWDSVDVSGLFPFIVDVGEPYLSSTWSASHTLFSLQILPREVNIQFITAVRGICQAVFRNHHAVHSGPFTAFADDTKSRQSETHWCSQWKTRRTASFWNSKGWVSWKEEILVSIMKIH